MTDLKYIIENELLIICPFLSTDRFISYCKDRGIRTSRQQLEQFEKLGIFYPIARVQYPKIKIKIEYINDHRRIRDLGVLKDGEEWSGDIEEVYAHFSFEKEYAKDWLDEGFLWEPRSRPFHPWETFMDEEGDIKIENFFSVFQCYALYKLIQSTAMELRAEWWVSYSEKDIDQLTSQLSDWANTVISAHQKNWIRGRDVAGICQVISNRYFPKTQSDRRTIQFSIHTSDHDWNWRKYCRNWNAKAVLTDIGITIEELKQIHEQVAMNATFADPLGQWYGLISFVSVDQKERLKDKALLAQTLYSMEHMLRLFYQDITAEKLRPPDELRERWKDRFYGDDVKQNELRYLEFLANQYHLNPRPNLILVVEGDGEAEQFPRLAKELLGCSFSRLGIEVLNLQGVGNLTGKKGIEMFIDAYHHRQTIVFIIVDNEGRPAGIKKRLVQAQSKYNTKRRVTKDEYIYIWDKNIEFDNFSHDEIAEAMTKLCEGRYTFQSPEIANWMGGRP